MEDDAYIRATRERRDQLWSKIQVKFQTFPEYAQLMALDAVLRAFDAQESTTILQTAPTLQMAPEHLRPLDSSKGRKPLRRHKAKGKKPSRDRASLSGKGNASGPIIEAAEKYLTEKGSRAMSGEIGRVLQQRGVVITGQKPHSVVSSYLSQSLLFNNIQGQGYGLRRWSSDIEGAGAATSIGLNGGSAPRLQQHK